MKDILVVEDDLAIQEGLKQLLELEGYRVELARNGREALAALRADPTPRVILLDLMMPVMNGSDFCGALSQDSALAAHHVILMSADSNIEEKAKRLATKGFLKKPLELDEVLRVIAQAGTPA
jgi:CheY-like chemotaxis protein